MDEGEGKVIDIGPKTVRHYARLRIRMLRNMYSFYVTSGQRDRAFDQKLEIRALIQIIRWLEGTKPRRDR